MDHSRNSWALLIGVESYFPGKKRTIQYPNLRGCVRDVRALERYLRDLGVRNIKLLTASGDNGPTEPSTDLPVYGNIKHEFERIIQSASPGDFVYIHYSGHGIRRGTLGTQQVGGGDNITGTALALADVMDGGAYLTGYQLGTFVKRMVKSRGLRVTLVLDSCFSGQGFRKSEGYTLRTVAGQSDDTMLPSDQDADGEADTNGGRDAGGEPVVIDNDPGLAGRKAHVKRSWLLNPSGCTVLTACQFDETAGEYNFPDKDGAHGVLTYWMLKGLAEESSMGRRPSYAEVKEYVRLNIMRMKPKPTQSPVLYGDGDFVFFGKELVVEKPACHILSRDGEYVNLDIGKAQGAAEGAIYDVYPVSQVAGSAAVLPLRACITELDEDNLFRSTAELIVEDPMHLCSVVGRGSRAVLQAWAIPCATYVNISLPDTHIQKLQIESFQEEIEQIPNLFLQTNSSTSETAFTVVLTQCNKFEIQANGKRLPRVPRVSIEDEKWMQRLLYLLRHLARFRALGALPNDFIDDLIPSDTFSFTPRTVTGDWDSIKQFNGRYHVRGGQKLVISFRLKENFPYEFAYVSFYCFSSSWGIHKLHPGPGQGVSKIPKGRLEKSKITIELPPSCNDDDLVDIEERIRAFVCTNEISWEELILPDLPLTEAFIPEIPPIGIVAPVQNISARGIVVSPGGFDSRSPDSGDGELGVLDLIFHTCQQGTDEDDW